MPEASQRPKRIARFVLLNLGLGLGLLLFGFMYWNETLNVPVCAEGTVRSVYNLIYIFVMPLRTILEVAVHNRNHSVSLPVRLVAYLFTPLIFTTLYVLLARARRERRARSVASAIVDGGITRRRFLVRSSKTAFLGGVGMTGTYSTLYNPWDLEVRCYDVPIKDLPASMDGYTIVQLSDTHYGPFVPLNHIRNAISIANGLNPDFTVLTGDYVLRTPLAIEPGIGILQHIKSKHGVAGVLGNHDHWEGAPACREAFKNIQIPLIDNTRTFLTAAGLSDGTRPGEGLCLAGVGDLWNDICSISRAVKDVDPDLPRILLSHNPDVAEERSIDDRIDVMLSGHTHGGQISVPYRGALLVPSSYGNKYAGGWCKGPRFPVIVSRGVGMTVLPYRFRVAPEIVHITLRQMRA